ncbi:hypothetical protein DRE_04619 [Drechslerella stenobrocha 248]|uniref:Obg domain-containing protein n=1 Tax=Drechslerella stenobrocha 248 TaxID=1043628 RepID=W7IAH3_9PEZI|nr:hypothetical protein DRE_04619 [Drechslerella stenobrocha 248]
MALAIAPGSTLLPFLYPPLPQRLVSRLLRFNHGRRHGYLQHHPQIHPRRPKSTLTASTARSILAEELPDTRDPSTIAAAAIPTDHRTPPFLDTLTLTLHSGHGGHGCVSFLREKFIVHGPPNGGDGGDGGDVYIAVDPQLSSLHKLSRLRIVKAGKGTNGQGGSRNGARGEDVVVKVPPGTVVRVLERGDPKAGHDFYDNGDSNHPDNNYGDDGYAYEPAERDGEWSGGSSSSGGRRETGYEDGEEEDEFITRQSHDGRTDSDPAAILEEKLKRRRRRNRTPRRFAKSNIDDPGSDFIHYPLSLAANLNSPHWPPRKPTRREVMQPDVFRFDFSDGGSEPGGAVDAAGRKKDAQVEPVLLLKGGAGGYGNPNFITKEVRRPMWATKGAAGSSMKLQLELKLLADVGLVGRPNVGKSSLLRCVTGSRARVGNWAFTTLKPNMGTVVLDGGLGMGDTSAEDGEGGGSAGRERFTIADIPGLVKDAGENKGLGWDFLRHVERARGLVFVIDLGFDPVRQVEGLWRDIEEYEKTREVERRRAAEEEQALREEERMRREDQEGFGVMIRLSEEVTEEVKPDPGIVTKPWMVVANKADLEGAERRFIRLRGYLDGLAAEGKVKQPIGCIAVSALKAGGWTEEEYEREADVWRGVIQWFRSLVS